MPKTPKISPLECAEFLRELANEIEQSTKVYEFNLNVRIHLENLNTDGLMRTKYDTGMRTFCLRGEYLKAREAALKKV